MLAERGDGSSIVELRNPGDGSLVRRIEALGPALTAERLLTIPPDADENATAVPLLAVLGNAADGAGTVLVLDAFAGVTVTTIAATESPQVVLDLAAVPGGSLAVLASDPDGNIAVRRFSLTDGAPLTDRFAFLAPDQTPRGLFSSPGTTPRLAVLASHGGGAVHAEQRDAESGDFIQDIPAQEAAAPSASVS